MAAIEFPNDVTDSQNPDTEGHLPNTDRVVLIGTTGAGKTTMATRIARVLDMPHIEFDALWHGPNWTETPHDVFRERLRLELQGSRWVGDGNYSVARDIVWSKATMLVWLDYRIQVVLWRLFRRTLRRGLRREQLWNGNTERLRWQFLSRKSLFLWALQSHWRRRRTIPRALAHPDYIHLHLVRLRSPKEARYWLLTLRQG